MKLRVIIILLELGILTGIIYSYIFFWHLLGSLMSLFSLQNLMPLLLIGLLFAIAVYKLWTFYVHTLHKTSNGATSNIIDADELPINTMQQQIGSWLSTTVRIQIGISIVLFIFLQSFRNDPYLIYNNWRIFFIIDLIIFVSAILTFIYIRMMDKAGSNSF